MKALTIGLIAVGLVLLAGFGFVYSGIFNVAADEPHWSITLRVMEATREHSIASRARKVGIPPTLADPQRIATGAEEYEEMCTGCHLAPGMQESEIRAGLYPKPPNLAQHGNRRSPAEAFWIIKHGLKMTGMPAWGMTHDDQTIWSMVAFLQRLPELPHAQYKELIAQARASGHKHGGEESGHSHEDGTEDEKAEGHSQGETENAQEPQAPAAHPGAGEQPKGLEDSPSTSRKPHNAPFHPSGASR